MPVHVIEVAIAIVASFFLVSILASAVVELVGIAMRKRSKDLLVVLNDMIDGSVTEVLMRAEQPIPSAGDARSLSKLDKVERARRKRQAPDLLVGTSSWEVATMAVRAKRGPWLSRDDRTPSYLSARSFADAVVEGFARASAGGIELPSSPLSRRLAVLKAEADDVLAVKAGLERWFDDTMERLEGAYKRWSQWVLLVAGLAFATALNVSTVRIAAATWRDATLSAAVAGAADKLAESSACPASTRGSSASAGNGADSPPPPSTTTTTTTTCTPIKRIEASIDELQGLKIPMGWGTGWQRDAGGLWTLLGIVPTALAVLMGAPFWFDLLTKLTGARRSRGEPAKAADDPGSATSARAALLRSPPSNQALSPAKSFSELTARPSPHHTTTKTARS